MGFLGRGGTSAIGLHVGAAWATAVQVRRDKGRPVLSAAARLPRAARGTDATPDEAGRIMDALDRQGFVGSSVVLLVPGAKLMSGVFDLPPRSSGAPLEVIARNELARTNRVEPDQIECGWWEVPAGIRETEGSQVIAVGCRHDDALAIVGAFEGAGARVCALDAPGPALARAVGARAPSAPALTALVEIGEEGALLVVLRGQTVVYERTLGEGGLSGIRTLLEKKLTVDTETAEFLLTRVGLGPAPEQIADEKELVEESAKVIGERIDDLAAEVKASAAYAGRRYGESVARVLLTGDGASIAEAAARMGRRLDDSEVTAVSARDLAAPAPGLSDNAAVSHGGTVLALGLALHEEGLA